MSVSPATAAAISTQDPVPVVRPLALGNLVIDPPVLQAPMAGYTNFAYRQVVREYGGVGLLATEMIAARSAAWLESERGEHPDRLWGVRDEPRPLAVQMWDNDPENLAQVGRRLARDFQVSVVDLNFGCPVRQVSEKAHSGSWLLREPERVGRIVRRVVEACEGTPVTAKIRLGCGPTCQTGVEVAQRIEEAGAACLTVHGRVASQFFKGRADWEAIAEIKRGVSRMPVVGNGSLSRGFGRPVSTGSWSPARPWRSPGSSPRSLPCCAISRPCPIRRLISSGNSCCTTMTWSASGLVWSVARS